jgi:hypothetical protein
MQQFRFWLGWIAHLVTAVPGLPPAIQHQFETRLPGMVVVGRQSGEYCLVQWATPIDETATRCFNINNWRRHGTLRALYERAHYYLWHGWAHDGIFSGQDKKMVEALVPGAGTAVEDRRRRHRLAQIRRQPCTPRAGAGQPAPPRRRLRQLAVPRRPAASRHA